MKRQIFLLILSAAYFIGSFLISCNNTAYHQPLRKFTRTVDTIIDANNNGMHDPSCCCKLCFEDYPELNYYRLEITNINGNLEILLIDNYTRDTIADLSDDNQLIKIIKDNE